MRLLWKLLRKNMSVAQISGFAIANLLGVTVLLLGIQFFNDSRSIFAQNDSFMKNDYIIISKQVSLLGSVLGDNSTFSDSDIQEIENKDFTVDVGRFSSSDFSVYASIGLGSSRIASDIFFESVPDKFLDLELDKWHFSEGDTDIPIIVPRNYLNLYNFGFSQSRNLPKLTESAISMVKFDVRIANNNIYENFRGNIVGFSNRLNTILVPESFMRWANRSFGSGDNENKATRLIVEVKNRSDKQLLAFLKDKGYEVEGDALNNGEMAYFARVITLIVLVIGLVVTLLSVYILILSVFLLLEKNSSKIETLIFIGHSPWRIILPYLSVIGLVNLIIIIISSFLAIYLRGVYVAQLSDVFPFENSADFTIFGASLTLYFVTMFVNMMVIRRKVLSVC